MPHPVWKGHISFGLVSVPVALYSGERRVDLRFHLIDSRNSARVRYERVNEETGAEVPWDKIVKGYEYDNGNYVFLSEAEMDKAAAELTRLIEIESFVDVDAIDVRHFDRPYILVPQPKAEKGYALLRDAIGSARKAGIATVVIRAKQHLAALMAHKSALILELLRFKQELVDLDEHKFPGADVRKLGITSRELELARELIEGMTVKWNPASYRDKYRDLLLKFVEKKIASGKTKVIEKDDTGKEAPSPRTINFMDELQQSVKRMSGKRRRSRARGRVVVSRRQHKARAS